MITPRWPPERTEQARALHAAGLSSGVAARELGVTRNSIIGKWYRLGLRRRASLTQRLPIGGSRPRKQRDPAAPRAPRPARPRPPRPVKARIMTSPPEPPQTDPITLMQLGGIGDDPGRCRWPIGEPAGPDTLFCGAPRERGAYCAWHGNLAYRAPETVRQERTVRMRAAA